MPEPRLEEGDNQEDNKQKNSNKKSSNPLASLLKKKVKIFGREIPMPLIILGALGIGIVIFTLIGKKGKGGNNDTAQQEESNDFGYGSSPENLGEFAQGSANTSLGEIQSDLGSVLPVEPLPSDSFSPQPLASYDLSPLPMPDLPYSSGFADSFAPPPPMGEQYPINVPYEQSPIIQNYQPVAPSEQPTPNPLSRLATGKVTAIASQSTVKPIVPPKGNTLPAPAKKAAKASGRIAVNQTSVRPPSLNVPPKNVRPNIPLPPKFQLPIRPPTPAKPKPPKTTPYRPPLPPKFQNPSRPYVAPKQQTPKRNPIYKPRAGKPR